MGVWVQGDVQPGEAGELPDLGRDEATEAVAVQKSAWQRNGWNSENQDGVDGREGEGKGRRK